MGRFLLLLLLLASSSCSAESHSPDAAVDGGGAPPRMTCAGAGSVAELTPAHPLASEGFEMVALSRDGTTLVVGAGREASSATGVDGDERDVSVAGAGAAFVYGRSTDGSFTRIAYLKASNTGDDDGFGLPAISRDGAVIAISAHQEASAATGIDGDQGNDSAFAAGAVYVFRRDGAGRYAQEAYVKASNSAEGFGFGGSLALSADGTVLAVGSSGESSGATGIDGDQTDRSAFQSGAVYVFRHVDGGWMQESYLKASNTRADTGFGATVAVSGDGETVAVDAYLESSDSRGVNGDQSRPFAARSGAVYVFHHEAGRWLQQAFIKGSNTDPFDFFGATLALSADGDVLATGAFGEDSGEAGNQDDESVEAAGAVYVFRRDGSGGWSQEAYVKPSLPTLTMMFSRVALSADAETLVVGALGETDGASGTAGAGAAYVFQRDGGRWTQRERVVSPALFENAAFGDLVSLDDSGCVFAVGSAFDPGPAGEAAVGAAFVVTR